MTFTINFPPIRELLKPDPGYVLVEGDLQRADAQFVAWEADEPELKKIFQSGLDIYTDEARWLYRDPSIIPKDPRRQLLKSCVHAANYSAKARTLAITAGVPIIRMEEWLSERWFGRFPLIHKWHSRIDNLLSLTREIRNVYGYRRFYFDRLDNTLPQALAWLCQSPVAITINRAMINIHDLLKSHPEWLLVDSRRDSIQLLLQIHDSLLMQVRRELCPDIFYIIIEQMQIIAPYKDPLIIPVTLKYSTLNWGKMISWKPGDVIKEMRDAA